MIIRCISLWQPWASLMARGHKYFETRSWDTKIRGEVWIHAAKSVEGAGPHDGAERCVAYLEAYLNVYPEQRAAAVKRLGGLVPVEMG